MTNYEKHVGPMSVQAIAINGKRMWMVIGKGPDVLCSTEDSAVRALALLSDPCSRRFIERALRRARKVKKL